MAEDSLSKLEGAVDSAWQGGGPCIFLTGAGISAESGIPTFRGPEGYWRVGSRNYHPQELATRAAFQRMPVAVWSWYVHRRRICAAARPNAAHEALAALDAVLGERLLIITQNVDGLHGVSGSPPERTFEVHGNIHRMRCFAECKGVLALPDVEPLDAAGPLPAELCCTACGGPMRPHVLWFDEYYDEHHYRFESSLVAIERASLLCVVGTTGTTSLPVRIGERAAARGIPMIVINPEPNPFSELAAAVPQGVYLEGAAGHWVPVVARQLSERAAAQGRA